LVNLLSFGVRKWWYLKSNMEERKLERRKCSSSQSSAKLLGKDSMRKAQISLCVINIGYFIKHDKKSIILPGKNSLQVTCSSLIFTEFKMLFQEEICHTKKTTPMLLIKIVEDTGAKFLCRPLRKQHFKLWYM